MQVCYNIPVEIPQGNRERVQIDQLLTKKLKNKSEEIETKKKTKNRVTLSSSLHVPVHVYIYTKETCIFVANEQN